MKRFGLITYQCPHLKTEQVILELLRHYRPEQLVIYALPYTPRPAREVLINHRPNMDLSVDAAVMARAHGIEYHAVNHDTEIPNGLDYYLVLIGYLLSAEFIRDKKTINTHPGIIPSVRGLDAVKWALYDMKPLGVTMHFIDEAIDAGDVISIVPTPVYETDTIDVLCRRHYENELYLTCAFERFLEHPTNVFAGIEPGEARRRMGKAMEAEVLERFDEYKRLMATRP
jgi:phosphoribosylglycinamide formyltransferase-1